MTLLSVVADRLRQRRLRFLASSIFCFAVITACSPGTQEEHEKTREVAATGRPSILLLTLDTTRPDHLQPYGVEGAETPTLSALADRGIVFDNAMAVAPLTAPAHATLLTGLYPSRHGVRNNLTHYLPTEIPTLAEWLAARGYRTAAFVSAVVLERRYGLDQGFEDYDDELEASATVRMPRMITERTAEATTDRALDWLDALGPDESFFLWVHYYDPHLPYSPPTPWAERFAGRPYDGEIAYMDSQIGRLLRHPRTTGEDVAVFAIGDHGEGLGEHGEKAHGLLVYDSTLHIPWIMRLPGGPSGARIATPISQVDLVPTIAEMVTVVSDTDFEELEGRSLLPLLDGDDWTSERLLFAESEVPFLTYGWARLRAARQGETKYIDAPEEELYDLAADPHETSNLAADRQAAARRLAAEIDAWAGRPDNFGSTVPVDAGREEMLRAIGYVTGDPGRPEGEGHGNPVKLIEVHEELQTVHGLMVTGQIAEAVSRVRAILDRDPGNLAALKDLSRGLLQLGRLDEATEVAAKASSLAPWSARARQVEADLEYRRGHHERALELIDESLRLDALFLEAHLDRSRYLADLGRGDEALQEIDPLLEEYPDNPWVVIRYVEVADLPAERFRAAHDRLRAVLAANPYLVEAWTLLAKVLVTAGRPSEAISIYREALEYRADDPDLKARLALLLAEIADPSAEAALRDAIRAAPAIRADLHVALGESLAAEGRGTEARQHFEIAARVPTVSPGNNNSRAMALLQLGRTTEAENIWRELIRDHPAYGRAWLNMASLSIQRRNWADAEQFANVAVKREPHSAPAWNNLGISLEELGRTPEAETAYRRASEVDRSDWRGLFNLGILLRKAARYDEAAAVQRQVLARDPANGNAHFELGILCAGPLGDLSLAKEHLRAAIAADPKHPRARQARSILERIP